MEVGVASGEAPGVRVGTKPIGRGVRSAVGGGDGVFVTAVVAVGVAGAVGSSTRAVAVG